MGLNSGTLFGSRGKGAASLVPTFTMPNDPPQSGDTLTASAVTLSWKADAVEFSTTSPVVLSGSEIGKAITLGKTDEGVTGVSAPTAAVVAAPVAIAGWRFEEASGTRMPAVGAYNLTDTGGVTRDTGLHGFGASFDAASSQSLTNAAFLLPLTGCMVSIWVNPVSNSSPAEQPFFSHRGMSAYQLNLEIYAGTLNVSGSTGDGEFNFTTAEPINSGAWNHIVFAHDPDNSQVLVYTNGAAPETSPITGNLVDDSGVLFIGADHGAFLTGVVDDCVIWSRPPTSGEVAALYNGGAGVQP